MRISDWSSDVCSSDLAHGSAGQRNQHQTQPGGAARAARSPPRAPAVTQRHADGLPIELHVVSRRPVDSSGVHPLLPGSLPFRRVEGSNGSSEAKNLGKNNQSPSRDSWFITARPITNADADAFSHDTIAEVLADSVRQAVEDFVEAPGAATPGLIGGLGAGQTSVVKIGRANV